MSIVDNELSRLPISQKPFTGMISFRLNREQYDLLQAAVQGKDRTKYIIARLFGSATPDRRPLRCVAELHALGIALRRAQGELPRNPETNDIVKRVVALIDQFADDVA